MIRFLLHPRLSHRGWHLCGVITGINLLIAVANALFGHGPIVVVGVIGLLFATVGLLLYQGYLSKVGRR